MQIIQEGKARIRINIPEKISSKMPVFYNPVMKFNRDISILLLNSIDKDNMQIADVLAGSGIRAIRFIKELKKGKIKRIFVNDYNENFFKTIKNNFSLNKIHNVSFIKSRKNPLDFLCTKKFLWNFLCPRKTFGFSQDPKNSLCEFFRTIKNLPTNKTSLKNFESINKKNNFLKKINSKKIIVTNEDANLFLLNSFGFDYIDIDPFGSPNKFLDAAIKRIARDGILAVTATDTAPLCGTYVNACKRKYWAMPVRNELMHEIGLRILIRKVQLIGAQYDKALIPIFSYYKDHYFRTYFRCEKSKKAVDKIMKQHGFFNNAGPMWIGELWDKKIVLEMKNNTDEELKKFIETVYNESKIKSIGFFDIHKICKKSKSAIPKYEILIKKIRKKGYKAERTHFNDNGIRSDIPEKKLIYILKEKSI